MDSLHPPSSIRQYRILRRLGAGGMGEVYLALDTLLERQVAIKFLMRGGEGRDRDHEQVLREARAAAGLDHHNICPVFEVGEHGDRPFIVMQYVEGDTLATVLAGGRLDPGRALEIAEQIADALHAAHSRGIVHRDIKPQNIIITPSGQAKLLDFGVAKVTPLLSPTDETRPAAGGDRTGQAMVGTPAYMAPEQARGGKVDGRADLFALGAVLYECLTGRPAFSPAYGADGVESLLHTEPPPPSTVVPNLSRAHDTLCQRLMAKTPDARFNTAADALAAVRHVRMASQRGRFVNRRSVIAAGVSVLLGVTLGAWHYTRTSSFDLETVPEGARRWYEQGAEAIREGAYTKARRALTEAVAQHERFPLAHARLAEALSELDESGPAKTALLRVHELVGDLSRLPAADRLRLDAIGAMVVRDFAKAVESYSELARLLSTHADVQVDLGRAFEGWERPDDALAAYRRAIELDPASAVGHLRLGVLLGERGDEEGTLQAFEKAQALYHSTSNTEGLIETLVARGSWLNARGRLTDARRDLERAVRLSSDTGLTHQRVRGLLKLSSVMASEGGFEAAENMARTAVELARTSDMEGLAASNLIEFGNVLLLKGRRTDAAGVFAQADELAQRRGARRTEARAALSRASVLLSMGRSSDAIPFIERGLAFYKGSGYSQTERLAQTLLASAYAGTGELERARAASEELLTTLRAARDNAAVAVASERLSGVLLDMGRLPEALASIRESRDLNRAAGNQMALPFILIREADVLARLGRFAEATTTLAQIEAELAAGREAYVARAAVIGLVSARVANVKGDWSAAHRAASRAADLGGPERVSLRISAEMQSALALANLGRRSEASAAARSAIAAAEQTRDVRLLLSIREHAVLVFDRVGESEAAYAAAETALVAVDAIPNHEVSWRLHALAALAAERLKRSDAAAHRAEAETRLETVRNAWEPDVFASYAKRPDVMLLRKRAGL